MENINLKEDLATIGEPASDEEKLEVEKAILKKTPGMESVNIDGITKEDADELLVKLTKEKENIDIRCKKVIKQALKEKKDVVKALQESIGFKESEATEVYYDFLSEKRIKESENAEDLKAKEKEEILMFNEPEADVLMGGHIFKVDKVDHQKDLEDQKGEKLGKYKIEGIN